MKTLVFKKTPGSAPCKPATAYQAPFYEQQNALAKFQVCVEGFERAFALQNIHVGAVVEIEVNRVRIVQEVPQQ
jgi:hypothetical protein